MKNLQFNSYAKQIDGEQYCSEVETLAENMIEGNVEDAVMEFPGGGNYITGRSSKYRRLAEEVSVELPLPIYAIKNIKLKPFGVNVGFGSNNGDDFFWEDFKNEQGEYAILDITPFVFTDVEWQSLPIADPNGTTIDHIQRAYKNNTLFYARNEKELRIRADRYWFTAGTKKGEYYAFIGLVALALKKLPNAESYWSDKYYDKYGRVTLARAMEFSNPIAVVNTATLDPRPWKFQIKYIPIPQSTKMKAHKAEKKPRKYAQIVNQRAEVNNAEAFGKYLHTTAQKTGTEKIAIAKTYTKIADVPPVGAVVWHNGEKYRLVANSWSVTNTVTFTVTHTLSKNWSSKSKHVAVDQKYRNWNIPFDDYVWRTVYYEEFIELSGSAVAFDSAFNSELWENALKVLFSLGATDTVLQNMWLINRDNSGENGCVLPVSTQGIGKSLVFSAATKDTLSAGLRVDPATSEYCEEVLYCNADGTMDEMTVILSHEIAAYDDLAYPYATLYNENRPPLFNGARHFAETFALDKDPGEAIKVTVQCHFIPTENWIVVGNAMAKDHPFVSGKAKTGLKIWLLKDYIRDGVDKIIPRNNEDRAIELTTKSMLLLYITCNGTSVKLPSSTDWTEYKAWAITDMDNNLYLGSNDIEKREIFINIRRNRT